MNKKSLSERDICTKFITPTLIHCGWDLTTQIFEEYSILKCNLPTSSCDRKNIEHRRADYVLFYDNDHPIAVIEAKANKYSVDAGIEQAKKYTQIMDIPFAFSSNGNGFVFYNRFTNTETYLALDKFPSPGQLWSLYLQKGTRYAVEHNNSVRINQSAKTYVICPFCNTVFDYTPAMRGKKLRCICRRLFYFEEAIITQNPPGLRSTSQQSSSVITCGIYFIIGLILLSCIASC